MPDYSSLRPIKDFKDYDYELVFPELDDETKIRIIKNLIMLREGLSTIPDKLADKNLIMASWNIKEFGHTKQRLPESYFYIAEIMSRFDLIAVQEVKSTLKDLDIVIRLLGDDWKYIINDVTEGPEGNRERSAYIYDTTRIRFSGLAGEIIFWEELTKDMEVKQLKRTPFITGFEAGWKEFAIINFHLHPGDDDEDTETRRQELELLLKTLEEKKKKGHLWTDNLILSGDFNLYEGATKDDSNVQMINDAGFFEVQSLKGVKTNVSQTETYDRLFISSNDYFEFGKNAAGIDKGSVFLLFDYVFKLGDEDIYQEFMEDQYTGNKDTSEPGFFESYFKNPWRKNQMSDHLPIWIELIIDSSDEFLDEKLGELSPHS
jgi:endonuclease/exonuclease/phosphatase family metal-dependent hydrolase